MNRLLIPASIAAAFCALTTIAHAQPSGSACVPGAQSQCACPGGANGVQVCADAGDRLGPCNCSAAPPPRPGTYGAPHGAYAPDDQPAFVARPLTERSNAALYGTGISFMILGGAGVLTGVVLITAGALERSRARGCGHPEGRDFCLAGGVVTPLAASFLIAGIPMTILGGKKVPIQPSAVSLAPELVPDNLGAGLRWRF